MGEVTICSSAKYYGVVQSLAGKLVERQVVVNTPRFDFAEGVVEVAAEQKWALTHEFLGKIRRSACIYVVAESGYTGSSVCVETGFAAALGIPVFISQRPVEEAVNALVREVVSVEDAPDFLTGLLGAGERL